MQTNTIAVALGCAGLVIGGIGLAAQHLNDSDVPAQLETTRAAQWPPHPTAAGVDFHDEMITLLTPPRPARVAQRPEPRGDETRGQAPSRMQPQGQEMPAEGMMIKTVRAARPVGTRRTQFYEIEFVDGQGRIFVRRYNAEDGLSGRAEPERAAPETYGYSPRRSRDRRSRRNYR